MHLSSVNIELPYKVEDSRFIVLQATQFLEHRVFLSRIDSYSTHFLNTGDTYLSQMLVF